MQAHQLNLQKHLGGGEVYTAFLCRALDMLGVETVLYCHPEADFWQALDLPARTQLVRCGSIDEAIERLPAAPQWLLTHGPAPRPLRSSPHLVCAIAHMPAFGRRPDEFAGHAMVFPVSNYVHDGLEARHIPAWPHAMYGVASSQRATTQSAPLMQTSPYDWDRNKWRDRTLGWLEPLCAPFIRRPVYRKRPGITLGIVSRLTPIKQFPQLFAHLGQALSQHPEINLEIFGSGGYATVRDMRRSLAPVAGRVRFWGQQKDVTSIYAGIDYLLTGLPEKEALGLNVLEAQACGTPVLAVNAPPFTETVIDGRSGYLFTDPRQDGGEDFSRLLSKIVCTDKPDPRLASEHLAQFSFTAFVERWRPVVAWVQSQLDKK